MTLSLLKTLRAGPPPPKVVLLPDGLFFTRSVPVAPGSTAAEVAGQVELALETLSPFPPAQLYHGFYWTEGAARVLIFAAYRRRFTNDQAADWPQAELVLPSFAALLGGEVKPDTTLIAPSPEGLTAIYWDGLPVPSKIAFRPLSAEATDQDRYAARDELLAAFPRNRQVVLAAAPAIESARSDRELAFRAEGFVSRIPVTRAAALDVRDKAELAALRRARARDLALWRGFLAFTATLLLLGVGEMALIGAGAWQKTRQVRVDAQRPVVEKIETAQSLTTRINELSTKRLLPFEMILAVSEGRPAEVTFQQTATTGLYGLTVRATSTSPGAVSAYQQSLATRPAIEKVDVRDQQTRDNVMNFTLIVSFRPDGLKPSTEAAK